MAIVGRPARSRVSLRGDTVVRDLHTALLAAIASCCAPGCLYGFDTERTVTLLGDTRYAPTTSVSLYFRAPPADACTPLALLEVAGKRFEETDALFPKLEQDAMNVGANAIFSVTATQTSRSEGELIGEVLDRRNHVYSSQLMTGLAARCRVPAKAPPDGALGYRFGARPAAVGAVCSAQGHVYSESDAMCDGTPDVVGFPAKASFRYCDDALCKIDVTGSLDAHTSMAWQAEFGRLEARLARHYGTPSVETMNVPSRCLGDSLLECLAAKRASHEYEWRFANRTSVWLIATGAERAPAVRIVYGRAPSPPPAPPPPTL
jgi:hypothetical protein